MWWKPYAAIFLIGIACLCGTQELRAASVALKSGETVELGPVYWVARCRSIMVGTPEVEILQAPEEISLTFKEGLVLPRQTTCANQVPGGTLLISAKEVKEQKQGKLIYRIKYKTKDGDRQRAATYDVLLFP